MSVLSRIKDKEIDAKREVEKQKVSINKQIPYVKDANLYKPSKKKKKKNKKSGEGSSSNGGNSSDEEGKSGDDANNTSSANESNSNQ